MLIVGFDLIYKPLLTTIRDVFLLYDENRWLPSAKEFFFLITYNEVI